MTYNDTRSLTRFKISVSPIILVREGKYSNYRPSPHTPVLNFSLKKRKISYYSSKDDQIVEKVFWFVLCLSGLNITNIYRIIPTKVRWLSICWSSVSRTYNLSTETGNVPCGGDYHRCPVILTF